MSIPKRFYTVAEVAGLLGVNEKTVRRWIIAGDLVSIQLGGRSGHRIDAQELEKFLDRKRTASALTRQLLAGDADGTE